MGSRTDVRVTAVIPGWIGLPRAHREWAMLPAEEQRRIGPLIAPERIAAEVAGLLADGRPGEVRYLLRGDEEESTSRPR
jgi:NAD(P)-dependent dehydrogenase (short-subunit alcohol dehydrogenase family)